MMAKKLGTSKIVHVHPMRSERHSEKSWRCIRCGNRLKDAISGREECKCGTQNWCETEMDKNRIVYVTSYWTI